MAQRLIVCLILLLLTSVSGRSTTWTHKKAVQKAQAAVAASEAETAAILTFLHEKHPKWTNGSSWRWPFANHTISVPEKLTRAAASLAIWPIRPYADATLTVGATELVQWALFPQALTKEDRKTLTQYAVSVGIRERNSSTIAPLRSVQLAMPFPSLAMWRQSKERRVAALHWEVPPSANLTTSWRQESVYCFIFELMDVHFKTHHMYYSAFFRIQPSK